LVSSISFSILTFLLMPKTLFTKHSFLLMPDSGSANSSDDLSYLLDDTGDDPNTGSLSYDIHQKRSKAGRAGGLKTASQYDMRAIGALGGRAAQKKGTAHKLTSDERSRGGAISRRH
jgi:hypothetical protein